MQYLFSLLVLGDSISAIQYIDQGKLTNESQDQELSKWSTTLSYGENQCIMELTVPVAIPNYDEILPASDGIIYFVNPNSPSEIDLFKEIIGIIQHFRRDLPTIVIFHDPNKFISLPTNQLLSLIWSSYTFEAFVADYISKNQLTEILDTLAVSLMKGEIIVNYNTAWMQIPVLANQANIAIEEGKWAVAARMTEKLAKIGEKLGLMDQHIYAEQAAWLYAKANDYLKAANVIKSFNGVFSERYRRIYVEYLLDQGNQLNRQKKFALAAQQYEKAGNWAKIELTDPILAQKMFKFAVYSWVSACEIQNAFALLENFDHNEMIQTLDEITQKIAGAADFLVAQGKYEEAKTQIYLSFDRYQKAGLPESIKILAIKVIKILKHTLEDQLYKDDVHEAKMSLDELINIWESYDVKKENIDEYLEKIVRLFIRERDFSKVDALIPKFESLELQRKMTDLRMHEEESIKEEFKQGEIEGLNEGVEILLNYVKNEAMIFYELNKRTFDQAERMVANQDFVKAGQHLKKQADWLHFMGQEQLSFDVQEHALDIYLKANTIAQFLSEIMRIPEERRKEYLKKASDDIKSAFDVLNERLPQPEFEKLINSVIKLYRNHLLYDESRIFAEVLIQSLIQFGSILASHHDGKEMNDAIEVGRKIEQLSGMYLDNKEFDLDGIFVKIVEYKINQDDLINAHAFNDKLNDKTVANEFNSRMEKIESQRSGALAQKAKGAQELKIFADQLSQLKNLSRDQKMAQSNLEHTRTGLKRRYYQDGLDRIKANNLTEAVNTFIQTAIELAKTKKFELAGVTTAVIGIITLNMHDINLTETQIKKIDAAVGSSRGIFHETYQMRVMDYIIQMMKARNLTAVKEAIRLLDVLPLFPEERSILEKLMKDSSLLEKSQETPSEEGESLVNSDSGMNILINKIEHDPTANSRRLINSFESKYWTHCQDAFADQDYQQASTYYMNYTDEFLTRKNEKIAVTTLIMGFLSLLKIKSAIDVYRDFEKYIFHLKKQNEKFTQLAEIKVLDYFIQKYEDKAETTTLRAITDAFQAKLPLYDWEKAFILSLNNLVTPKAGEGSKPATSISIAGDQEPTDDAALLTQQIVVLTQQMSSMKNEFTEWKSKRDLGRRAYYNEILESIKNNRLFEASEKYLNLSKRMARRNDYDLAGLMIVLSTLCRVKGNQLIPEIKSNVNETLKSLGIVEKILSDTLGIKLTHFVLDAMNTEDESIRHNLTELLRKLPLLDDESSLIQF